VAARARRLRTSKSVEHRPLPWHFDPFEDCLANAYLELGRFDEAISEYERILRLNPNYPLVQYHLAQAYERKGQPDQARASYERFLQVWKDADPDVPEIVAARRVVGASSRPASENVSLVRPHLLRIQEMVGANTKPRSIPNRKTTSHVSDYQPERDANHTPSTRAIVTGLCSFSYS